MTSLAPPPLSCCHDRLPCQHYPLLSALIGLTEDPEEDRQESWSVCSPLRELHHSIG